MLRWQVTSRRIYVRLNVKGTGNFEVCHKLILLNVWAKHENLSQLPLLDALGRDSRLIIIELYIISHMICYLAIFKLLNKSFLSHTAIQILKFL